MQWSMSGVKWNSRWYASVGNVTLDDKNSIYDAWWSKMMLLFIYFLFGIDYLLFFFLMHNFVYFSFLQTTPPPIGYTRAPPGRRGARIRNIKRWSWRRNFCSTCTWRATGAMRWRERSTWRRGKSRSGSKTGGWKWRNRARINPRINGIYASVCTHWKYHRDGLGPARSYSPRCSTLVT